jgi:hypothetical protein
MSSENVEAVRRLIEANRSEDLELAIDTRSPSATQGSSSPRSWLLSSRRPTTGTTASAVTSASWPNPGMSGVWTSKRSSPSIRTPQSRSFVPTSSEKTAAQRLAHVARWFAASPRGSSYGARCTRPERKPSGPSADRTRPAGPDDAGHDLAQTQRSCSRIVGLSSRRFARGRTPRTTRRCLCRCLTRTPSRCAR